MKILRVYFKSLNRSALSEKSFARFEKKKKKCSKQTIDRDEQQRVIFIPLISWNIPVSQCSAENHSVEVFSISMHRDSSCIVA